MYDEAWENFRGEVHEWAKRRDEDLLKKWLSDIGCKEPIGYYRDSWNHEMIVYTTSPGKIIGKAGINIDKLKVMMADEFHSDWRVKLVEIRGGFVNV